MDENLTKITSEIISSYVAGNSVASADLPRLIAEVHATLARLESGGGPAEEEPPKLVPPVPIRKTITPDFITSLEDGKQYKSLKRHLTKYGMTPDDYRAKWGLPADYPMVAQNYAKHRSELAKSIGLGSLRKKAGR